MRSKYWDRLAWITLSIAILAWTPVVVRFISPPARPVAVQRVVNLESFADSVRTYWRRDLSVERDSIVAREARAMGVPETLAIAVSHAENWTGDSTAVSSMGAIGLMQVMPDVWGWAVDSLCQNGRDLYWRRCNAGVGVFVMWSYHAQHGDWSTALRAYNGALHNVKAGRRYLRAVKRHLPNDYSMR